MNWQQILTLVIIVGVAAIFVWRSSSPKHRHSCKCGCSHDDQPDDQKEEAGR